MKRLVVPVVILLCAAVPASATQAASKSEHLAKTHLEFSTKQPASATGLSLTVRFGDPVGSANKPPRLTKARFVFPKHMRIDTGVRPQCTATDQELQTEGPSACPAKSQVGKGTITADPSAGQHVTGDDTVINGKHEIIEVVTAPGTTSPAVGIDRLSIHRNVVTAHPPSVPGGPPDGTTNIRRISFHIKLIHPKGHAYIRTPTSCPASGHWLTVGHYRFADDRTAKTRTAIPCRHRD